MAAETPTTGFEIDGKFYEFPALDSYDMDELQVLYDYSSLTIEDFQQDPKETAEETEQRAKLFKNPAVIRSIMHVAYQRAHPELKPDKVKAAIGKAKMLHVYESIARHLPDEEDQPDPPVSTTEPDRQSPSGSVTSNASSGDDSTNGSDQPDDDPANTGTGRSDTSSPPSDRMTLVP